MHVAANFGLGYGVHCLLEAGVDVSPCENSCNLTPLQCAAAVAGQEMVVAMILTDQSNACKAVFDSIGQAEIRAAGSLCICIKKPALPYCSEIATASD